MTNDTSSRSLSPRSPVQGFLTWRQITIDAADVGLLYTKVSDYEYSEGNSQAICYPDTICHVS
jgi:hypothetical protein